MRCRLTDAAARQLNEIHKYICQHDLAAADAVVERVYSSLESLRLNPDMGRATNVSGLRAYPLVRFPYLVFYRVRPKKDEIWVVSIRHAARRHPGFQESAEQFAR
jgi:plasmid stabilization system protein ParE